MIMMDSYNTMTFSEVWGDSDIFMEEYLDSPFAKNYTHLHYGETIGDITYPNNVELLFALLYARYGNSPIANKDVYQFKNKLFSIIFKYGLTWEKKLELQDKIRNLSENELLQGNKTIYNKAYHNGQAPSTNELEETTYIDEQNTANYKRGKIDSYLLQWQGLSNDVTSDFISRFQVCFKKIIAPERGVRVFSDYEGDL